jgi:hypothetical protein
MIGELVAAFLGGATGAAIAVRFAPGAWPWERTKQAGAGGQALEGSGPPRPVLQLRPYDQDEDTPPRGIPPLEDIIDSGPHPMDMVERERKWAERRRISEAKPKPVGL